MRRFDGRWRDLSLLVLVATAGLPGAPVVASEGPAPVSVVVVDLAASSPGIAAVSVDANAPGLAELMQGDASFTQVITKDKFSRVQLVSAGRPGFDRALLQSPRLALAIDALLRVYDHVLLDAGTASDLPAELLTAYARAVVVPDASMEEDARAQMCAELKAAGFSDVTMLSTAYQPSEKISAVSSWPTSYSAAAASSSSRSSAKCLRGLTFAAAYWPDSGLFTLRGLISP